MMTVTLNDGTHAQLRPGRAGGSVTQRGAGQGWSKGCSEEFNTSRLTWALRHVHFFLSFKFIWKSVWFSKFGVDTPPPMTVSWVRTDHTL